MHWPGNRRRPSAPRLRPRPDEAFASTGGWQVTQAFATVTRREYSQTASRICTTMLMKQAIAGVTPTDTAEVTIMTVWPSNSAYGLGRWLGRLYSIEAGTYIFRLGNLIALLSIPVALVAYAMRLAPGTGMRYRLTNRRIILERGLACREEKSIALDQFDQIEISVQPGQQWYHAGDLIFLEGKIEKLRLLGVSRPESFRQVCLKAHMGYVGVKQALR